MNGTDGQATVDGARSPSSRAQPDLLEPFNFATRFARGDVRNRDFNRLRQLFTRLSNELTLEAFAEWLDDLIFWLASTQRVPDQAPNESAHAARLRIVHEAMAHLPRERDALRAAVTTLLTNARAVSLFTDVGVPSRQAFFSEVTDRLARAVLPDPPVADQLGDLLTRTVQRHATVEWFESLTADQANALFELFGITVDSELAPLRRDLAEAALVIATRVAHHGLANDLRDRSPRTTLQDSPFYRLPEAVREAIEKTGVKGSAAAGDLCREAIAQCRKRIHEVEASLERTGVSVDLVYRLDLIRRQLDRLYALLGLIAPPSGRGQEGAALRFLLTLVRGAMRDRSVIDLFRSSTKLLARRVVDAAAHSGGYYVTRSPKELHALFSSATGGGFLTAFTALFKTLLSWAGLAPFWEGFFYSVNYAGSFITMQLLGFTLASKQPAVTAAHLARVINENPTDQSDQLRALAHEVAHVVRSQLAATVGNLSAVVPTAIAIDLGLRLLFDRGLLDADYANKIVSAHHPFLTALLPGAMVTGIALTLSSITAGTVENWVVYRRLPEALATHRTLRATLGSARAQRLSQWLLQRVAGFGGNVALGLQMGLVPTLAAFFGVPLQLPHVTVSTGLLAFAGMTRGPFGVLQADFFWACVGVALVGTLNFGVSFALALAVAMRAKSTELLSVMQVARAVLKLFQERPLDFVRAPRDR